MIRKTTALIICFAMLVPTAVRAQRPDSFTSFGAYWKHRVSHFRTLPDTENEICFLGDSITDGCEWRELTGILRVTNRGISGDTAWGVLARLDEVTEGRPEKIFLMIGTNDLARGRTPIEVRDKIAEVIDAVNSRSPRTTIYLQSVLPTDESKAERYRNENITLLNLELRSLAAANGVVWVDLAPAFKDNNGTLRGDLSEDGLHLNGQAYELWLSLIREYLK